jgi:hypothetical protein
MQNDAVVLEFRLILSHLPRNALDESVSRQAQFLANVLWRGGVALQNISDLYRLEHHRGRLALGLKVSNCRSFSYSSRSVGLSSLGVTIWTSTIWSPRSSSIG